jgi:hypothetical protein
MSVPVHRGPTWTAGVPTKLFEGQYYRGSGNNLSTLGRTYDVSPDGKRFLMQTRRRCRPNRSGAHYRRGPALVRRIDAAGAGDTLTITALNEMPA